jgi:hypothetical protein
LKRYKWNPPYGEPDGVINRMRALLDSDCDPIINPPRLTYMGSVPDPVLSLTPSDRVVGGDWPAIVRWMGTEGQA